MDYEAFRNSVCPGKLEATVFTEKRFSGGSVAYTDVSGYGFVPDDLPPSLDLGQLLIETQAAILEAERNLTQLDTIARDLENPYMLIGPFITREAKLSSAIENTFASAKQIALFDSDPSAVETENRQEVQEVRNYVQAMNHGYKSNLPISPRLVLEMHKILLTDVRRDAGVPGKFRTTQNAIGNRSTSFEDAKFVPTPPRFIDDSISALMKFIHDTESEIPRLIRFALSHYQFECIHPFDDGNGRLGRLLVSLQLCSQAQLAAPLVYVSGFFEQHRESYYSLLYNVSAKGEWMPWVNFFLSAIATQADDAFDRARRLLQLRQKYLDAVREKRASALLPKLVDRLFEHPAMTVSMASMLTETTPQTAGKLVQKLCEKKILSEVTGRKSHRVYIAPEILEAIES